MRNFMLCTKIWRNGQNYCFYTNFVNRKGRDRLLLIFNVVRIELNFTFVRSNDTRVLMKNILNQHSTVEMNHQLRTC